ncbi:hypothetical protein EB796_003498 [Bugula neritina]|uniref:Uncharacterized protein n=1 Tax=Bugula neritina TaxID=10212 RepID=A0A7J7KIW3_BUGNE|nr:hypothetical protein EB796_003498 [Bugula neritina]
MAKLLFLVNLKANPTPKLLSIFAHHRVFLSHKSGYKITILNILFPKFILAAEISNSLRYQSKLILRKCRTDH